MSDFLASLQSYSPPNRGRERASTLVPGRRIKPVEYARRLDHLRPVAPF
jgi:hypothetical protein